MFENIEANYNGNCLGLRKCIVGWKNLPDQIIFS